MAKKFIKNEKKGFFGKLIDKIDEKMAKKANKKCSCNGKCN